MRQAPKTKLKTRKSFLRRFRITKTGKVLHRVAFGNHLRRKKKASQKRRYRNLTQLKGKWAKKVTTFLGA